MLTSITSLREFLATRNAGSTAVEIWEVSGYKATQAGSKGFIPEGKYEHQAESLEEILAYLCTPIEKDAVTVFLAINLDVAETNPESLLKTAARMQGFEDAIVVFSSIPGKLSEVSQVPFFSDLIAQNAVYLLLLSPHTLKNESADAQEHH